MRLEKLLSPGRIGAMELKNRFVVTPMGTNFATYGGEVTEDMIAYYRRRARGGFGLIIIEVFRQLSYHPDFIKIINILP